MRCGSCWTLRSTIQMNPCGLKDIAKRQDISVKYLEQIISVLVRAEYLRSIRGPQGGYRLTKNAGGLQGRHDSAADQKAAWRRWTASWARTTTAPGHQKCVTLRLWKELDQAIKSVVDKYTLADLIEWHQEMGNDYVI